MGGKVKNRHLGGMYRAALLSTDSLYVLTIVFFKRPAQMMGSSSYIAGVSCLGLAVDGSK